MPKRYSRHMLRAQRLERELGAHREALERERGLLRYTSDRLRHAEHAIDEARYILGEHHAALPPAMSNIRTLSTSIEIPIPGPKVSLSDFLNQSVGMPTSLKVEDLYALSVQARNDDDRGRLHMYVRLGRSGEQAYAITHSALQSLSAEYLERELARNIAEQIAPLIVRSVRRRAA